MEETTPLFRPAKRRKFIKPQSSSEDEHEEPTPKNIAGEDLHESAERPSLSMAQILKRRQQNRSRGTGVSFSNSKAGSSEDRAENNALILGETEDPASDRLKAMSDRFVGHSEQVVNVDKHMMAYVDSEMAKRHAKSQSNPNQRPHPSEISDSALTSSEDDRPSQATMNQAQPASSRNPASLGQLQEIDLGPSAHQRAISQTSAALANPYLLPTEDPKPSRLRRPRLGRDGKPMRPRPRKRRPSADIARDALVEQVLKENRLDLYTDEATAPTMHPDEDGSDSADERLAAQFRQDFLDAMASRQQAHQPQPAKGGKAAPGEVGQKGPKLGGSRSARAAMAQARKDQEMAAKK